MKPKTSKLIQILLPIAISVIWSLCSILPPLKEEHIESVGTFFFPILSFLDSHRLIITFIVTIILCVILVYEATFESTYKKWLRMHLPLLMDDIFHNNYSTTRITVFKRVSGFRMFFNYTKHFLHCFFAHAREKTLKIHFKRFPNPFKPHLMIFVRSSQPHPKGSSTYFPVVESSKEAVGLSSYCFVTKQKQIVDTSYISDFYRPEKETYTKEQKKRIQHYIRDNYISEDLLKCIHRPSNHIYAEPIFSGKDEPWGVFVVDIDSKKETVFDDEIQSKLSSAIRLTSFILSKLS